MRRVASKDGTNAKLVATFWKKIIKKSVKEKKKLVSIEKNETLNGPSNRIEAARDLFLNYNANQNKDGFFEG
jgi:hypothetical protein